MPKVSERFGMRRSSEPKGASKGSRTFERHYLAEGFANEAAARDAIAAATDADGTTLRMPTTINSAPLVTLDLEEEMRPDLLAFSAKWELQNAAGGSQDNGEEGGDVYELSISTGGTTSTVTKSLETVDRFPHAVIPNPDEEPDEEIGGGAGAPDLKNVIGLSENGDVEGVDVVFPQWSEELTFYVLPELVTTDFLAYLFQLTGSVNSDQFRHFRPGECRFDGANASRQNGGNWRFTLKFAGRPNEVDLKPSPDLPVIPTKDGWDYLWLYRRNEILHAGDIDIFFARTQYAYVERVYPRKSFEFLANISSPVPTETPSEAA